MTLRGTSYELAPIATSSYDVPGPTSGASGPGVLAEVVYAEVDRALGVGDRRDHHCSESPLAVEDCRGADGDALTADPVGGCEADLEADRGAGEGQGDVGV